MTQNVNNIFQKAVKSKSKLRLAIFGTSGSGKTYSALRIAKGMAGKNGKVALIDTEAGSASKYSDRFDFDTVSLQDATIENMISLMDMANESGYDILVIDSMTHTWQELLEEIDKLAKAKYKGNTWSAWSDGTPKQKKFIKAILNSKCHIIATMRSKTHYDVQSDGNGKTKPVRVGLAPEAGKGIEYEFDMLMEISPEHIAEVLKDRTSRFQDKLIEKPDEKLGEELIEWLNEGVDIKPKVVSTNDVKKAANGLPTFPEDIRKYFHDSSFTVRQVKELCEPLEYNFNKIRKAIEELEKSLNEQAV